ncbi:MAG: Flp pilus assembly complex ATPase component TadA [Acidobacteria bacterium]|nr:Flp pilus assembly complex ATPase component TadA [Acidobacteriota bacterium]
MSLVPSLLQAIVRVDGEAMVMHAGDKPYVVSPTGQVELASRGLTLDAVNGIVGQLLPAEIQNALEEFGAIQYELPALPEFPSEHFTVVAARGGDDVWVEIRRRRVPDEDGIPDEMFPPPSATAPVVAAPVAPAPLPAVAAPVPAVSAPLAAVATLRAPQQDVVAAHAGTPTMSVASGAAHHAAPPVAAVVGAGATIAAEDEGEEISLDDLALPDETQLFGKPVKPFTDSELAEGHEQEIDVDSPEGEPEVAASVPESEPVREAEMPPAAWVAPSPEPAIAAELMPTAIAEVDMAVAHVEAPTFSNLATYEPEELPDTAPQLEIAALPQLETSATPQPEAIEPAEAETIELPHAEMTEPPQADMVAATEPEWFALPAPELVVPPQAEDVDEVPVPVELVVAATPEPIALEHVEPVASPELELVAPEPEALAAPEPELIVDEAPEPIAAPQLEVLAWPEPEPIAESAPVELVVAPSIEPAASPDIELIAALESELTAPPVADELPQSVPPVELIAAPPAESVASPEIELIAAFEDEPIAPPQPELIASGAAEAIAEPVTDSDFIPQVSEAIADVQPEAVNAFAPLEPLMIEESMPALEAVAQPPLEMTAAPTSEQTAMPEPEFVAPPMTESRVVPPPAVEEPEPMAAVDVPPSVPHAEGPVAERRVVPRRAPRRWSVPSDVEPPPHHVPVAEAPVSRVDQPITEAPEPWRIAPAIESPRPAAHFDEPHEIAIAAAPQAAVVLPISRSPIRGDQLAPALSEATMPGLDRLLRLASARGAATLYLSSDSRPSMRVDGELHVIDAEPVHTSRDVESLLLTLMPDRNHEALRSGAQTEWICDIDGVGRVRCMSFRDHRGPGGVFRLMPTRSVSVEQLGLPRHVQSLAIEPSGLVIIAGPRSSGKRTLMAAFVDLMNRTRRDHIITIEREINIVQEGGHSFISQREVRGGDDEMVVAARSALREDPDVLVIEDLRTGPLVNVALEAAAAGRLVVGGFSAHTAGGAIDRIIDLYAPEDRRHVQMALADSLRGVVVQVLLRKVGGGRLPAREVLLNTPSVSSVIAEGKTSQLPVAIEGGRRYGMVPMNDALVALVQSGAVDAREAYRQSPDRPGFLASLKRSGLDTSFAERFA